MLLETLVVSRKGLKLLCDRQPLFQNIIGFQINTKPDSVKIVLATLGVILHIQKPLFVHLICLKIHGLKKFPAKKLAVLLAVVVSLCIQVIFL